MFYNPILRASVVAIQRSARKERRKWLLARSASLELKYLRFASTRGLDIRKVRDRIRDDALLFTRWAFAH
jgi:hypothetical protein